MKMCRIARVQELKNDSPNRLQQRTNYMYERNVGAVGATNVCAGVYIPSTSRLN